MHPKVSLVLPVALFLLLAVLPTTSAQEAPDLTFTGHENVECDTTALELLCWDIEGDFANAFVAGEEITIKVVGPGKPPHNLHFIAEGEQDTTTYDTDGGASLAHSDTVSEGGETTFTFTVPTGVEKLYYWCDVGLPVVGAGGDHELFGMRGTVAVNPAPDETVENVTEEDETGDGNSTSGDVGTDDNSTAEPSGDGTGTSDGTTVDNNTTADGKDDSPKVEDSPLGGLVGLAAVTGLAVALRRRR
ncbi:MAG: hypothetical protein KY455_13485 [Euryarchaeota archaeon]|nr:hypothetical protein [Euryarchaeota archaeon]